MTGATIRCSLSAVALLAAVTAGLAQDREPAGVRAFVGGVLTREASDARFDWTSVLSARFRKAVEQDRQGGEIGLLDHDPLCMCQDPDGLRFRILSVRATPAGALAIVRVGPQTGTWHLTREDGAWRVADVSEALWLRGASVLEALEHAQRKSGKARR